MDGECHRRETIAVESAEAVVRDADVLCCATTSVEPVFDAEWIRPGTHVNGIGAFRLGMVELPPELFARASVAAVKRGLVSEAGLLEIGTFDAGWAETRDPQAITVFKSVSLAIQDVAAAELIVRRTGVTQESVAEARE